jgi:hypothetical protein
MRFFSNDAKENTDETDDKNPDRVESDPVTVPQQRAGSPWSDAPGSSDTAAQSTDSSDFSDSADGESDAADGELADRERRDGTEEALRADDSEVRHDGDHLVPDPDAPATAHTDDQPVDLPLDDRHETGTETPDEGTPAPEGEATTAYADEPAASTDPVVVEQDAVVVEDANATEGEAAAAEDAAVRDEGEFDSPTVVEPSTGEPIDDATATPVVEEEVVAVAAVPVAATPTGDASPEADRLFAGGDTYVERFREIQLRFVDSPKEATAEAATLVDEAIDKLTGALKAQKDGLAGDSDDTEQLRVALRSYRDILNRLTAL